MGTRPADHDCMKKPAAQDESGAGIEAVTMIYISSKYDGAEDSDAEDDSARCKVKTCI